MNGTSAGTSARSEDLYNDIIEVSRTAANIKIRTQAETFRRIFMLQSSMYAMLGAIAFDRYVALRVNRALRTGRGGSDG